MNRLVTRGFRSARWPAIIFATLFGMGTQAAAQTGVIVPPRASNLAPVHLPDVTTLEPEVRKQLLSSERVLTATINRGGATALELSAAYGMLGQIFHAYSLNAPARECYLNAGTLAPKDFRWIYLSAKLDQDDDHIDDALRRFERALSLRPDYVAARVNLGNIYLQLNRLAEAKQSYSDALAAEQNNPAAQYGLGQIALSEHRYAEAASYFERVVAQLPGANRVHYSLAMAYRGLRDNEKAKAHLALQGPVGVRVADPLVDNLQQLIAGERIHLVRGKLALESHRYAEAVSEFEKALQANPNSLETRINLGAALTETGDLAGAITQFEQALLIDPKNPNAHYNLGVLFAHEGKHEIAISHLQAVVATNANDLSARFLLAQELLKSNRLQEALSEFTRVTTSDPDNELAAIEQAKLLIRLNDYRSAREVLEKSVSRDAKRTQTAALLAYLLAAAPQYEVRDGARALELSQRIYQATPSTYHGAIVAMALAELGRCTEAATFVRMLIESPKDATPDLLKRLQNDLSRYERERPCRPPSDFD